MIKNLSPIIRIAEVQDAGAIAQNHIYSWQEMYKEFIPASILENLSLKERAQQWHDLIKEKNTVLVLEVDNQVIGFASICAFRGTKPEDLKDLKDLIGEISAIYLHPDYWRLGLGTILCQAALSELFSLGYKTTCLWVLSDNAQAQGFYASIGFEKTNTIKMEEFYEGGALLEEVLYKFTHFK